MRKHITLTQGDKIDPNTLSREQKFPGNFVANVHPDNLKLMRRAARRLGIAITEGEPRRSAGTTAYVGIYTDIGKHDPQALLNEFFKLLVARANARLAKRSSARPGLRKTRAKR